METSRQCRGPTLHPSPGRRLEDRMEAVAVVVWMSLRGAAREPFASRSTRRSTKREVVCRLQAHMNRVLVLKPGTVPLSPVLLVRVVWKDWTHPSALLLKSSWGGSDRVLE
eukprot:Rmarinus@m.27877